MTKGGTTVGIPRMKRVRAVGVVVAVALAFLATPAAAVSLGGDLPGGLGAAVMSYGPVDVLNTNPLDPFELHGTLTTNAYAYGANYLYVATLAPAVTGISVFSTSFAGGIAGFTGNAGWSWADGAAASGGPGADAFFPLEADGNLIFMAMFNWTNFHPISFFFESTYGPGVCITGSGVDCYSMTNQFSGGASGLFAVATAVPEPSTLLLLSSGLLAAGAWTRWSRRSA